MKPSPGYTLFSLAFILMIGASACHYPPPMDLDVEELPEELAAKVDDTRHAAAEVTNDVLDEVQRGKEVIETPN